MFFKGSPLDYKFFMTNFEDLVEKRVIDFKGRLVRLLKYTDWEAKELIKGCIYRKDDGYEHAKTFIAKQVW